VARDLQRIPDVLNRVTAKWHVGLSAIASKNLRTATNFSAKLREAIDHNPKGLHLLVVGIEVSLWLGEQFAADLVDFLRANAMSISANQFVGGDRVHFSSRDSKGSLLLPQLQAAKTVVLVISQSGQTFPSLESTARLFARSLETRCLCSWVGRTTLPLRRRWGRWSWTTTDGTPNSSQAG